MTRIAHHTAAVLAAVFIATATLVPVVTVPPLQMTAAAVPALA
jgi:hypothetical protein